MENQFCNNCGNQLIEGKSFCVHCGKKIIEHRDIPRESIEQKYFKNRNGYLASLFFIFSIFLTAITRGGFLHFLGILAIFVIPYYISQRGETVHFKQPTLRDDLSLAFSILGGFLILYFLIWIFSNL